MKFTDSIDVPAGQLTHIITHNLNDVNARLASANPNSIWLTTVGVLSRTVDTMTLRFNIESKAGSKLDIKVVKL